MNPATRLGASWLSKLAPLLFADVNNENRPTFLDDLRRDTSRIDPISHKVSDIHTSIRAEPYDNDGALRRRCDNSDKSECGTTINLLPHTHTDENRQETTNQFHIAPDRDSLSRVSDSLTSLSNSRTGRLDHHHAILKSLSRRLNGLEEGRRWEEDRHDAGGHAERMLKMDTEKFRVAKGVSDVEIEGERLEGELAGLRGQLEGLERQGVEGGWRRQSEGEDEVV